MVGVAVIVATVVVGAVLVVVVLPAIDRARRALALVDAHRDAVLTIDADGVIDSANDGAARLVGLPEVALVGTMAVDLAGFLPVLRTLEAGLTDEESVVHDVGGDQHTVLVTTRPVPGRAFRVTRRSGWRPGHPGLAVFLRDVTAQRALEERLIHDASHDALTGLANRAGLVAELDRARARARRAQRGFGLLFIDLDRFKAVNDTLGHPAGDAVLVEVARRLRAVTRDADLVARNGGDEFVVIAETASDITTVVRLADRIQDSLGPPVRLPRTTDADVVVDVEDPDAAPAPEGGQIETVPVSASIGVAWVAPDDDVGLERLRDADLAMYGAKATGPGQTRVFDDDMRSRVEARFDLERALQRAVGEGTLDVHVQPVLDIRTGRVTGGELLCRWERSGVSIPPADFIAVAEDSALVIEIGRWVLDRAARQLSEWAAAADAARFADLTLSVNVSGRHLAHPAVVDDVEQVCARWSVPPSRLMIELTETALLDDLAVAAQHLAALRDLGASVCVDDFGVGYASLRYLRALPLDCVKIDRSVVAGLGSSDADDVIASMLSRLAEVMDIDVVAEGVETDEQHELVGALGCDQVQGFLFAPPMPLPEFPTWLEVNSARHRHPSLG